MAILLLISHNLEDFVLELLLSLHLKLLEFVKHRGHLRSQCLHVLVGLLLALFDIVLHVAELLFEIVDALEGASNLLFLTLILVEWLLCTSYFIVPNSGTRATLSAFLYSSKLFCNTLFAERFVSRHHHYRFREMFLAEMHHHAIVRTHLSTLHWNLSHTWLATWHAWLHRHLHHGGATPLVHKERHTSWHAHHLLNRQLGRFVRPSVLHSLGIVISL